MRRARSDFHDASQALNKAGHIRVFEVRLAHTKLAILVIAHGIDLAAGLYDEGRVVLPAAHLSDQNVETTHLGEGMLSLLETDAQLSIVVI